METSDLGQHLDTAASPSHFEFKSSTPSSSPVWPSSPRSPLKRGSPSPIGRRSSLCCRRVAIGFQPDQDVEPNPNANLHQVLELVLCHGQDIKALVIGSTLNQHFQSYARHTAQLSARSLLHTWKAAVSQHTPQGPLLKQRSWKEQQLQCLLWLCKTAGPQFVNSHHAACSLLHTLKRAPQLAADDVLTTLKDAGLQLSDVLLVFACKEQLRTIPMLLQYLNQSCSRVYRTFALLQRPVTHEPMSLDSFVHRIVNILKNVKPSSVYDLLQMAISNPCEPFAAAAVEVLLQHDSQHVHLLHTLKDNLDPVFSGGGSSLAAGGSSVDGVVWVRVNQDCTAAQLLTQLMLASINSGHAQVLQVLTTVPAAQEIRTPAVVGLLQALLHSPQISKSASSSIAALITALPWSVEISSDTVLTILMDAVEQKVSSVAPILQLPATRQLSAEDVLGLLTSAVQSNLRAIVRELGRFALVMNSSQDCIMAMLRTLISNPWGCTTGVAPAQCLGNSCYGCLTELLSTGLLDKLTADDVLELLEYCVARGHTFAWWNTLMGLLSHQRLTDAPRFLQCFKAALQGGSSTKELQFPWHAPFAKQLEPSDWFDLLQCALHSPLRCAHPDIKIILHMAQHCGDAPTTCFSSKQVGTLVQLAAGVGDWRAVRVLCMSYAAQQLPKPAVTSTLQILTEAAAARWGAVSVRDGLGVPIMAAVGALLALPQQVQPRKFSPGSSAQDSSRVVSQLLQQGIAAHDWKAVQVLMWCPAVQQQPAGAVLSVLTDAVQHKISSVAHILKLPAARQLLPGDVLGLLPAAVQADQIVVVRQLGRFAVELNAGRHDIMAMLSTLISSPGAGGPAEATQQCREHSCRGCFKDLLSTGLQDKLTGDDVLELFECCVDRGHTIVWWNTLVSLLSHQMTSDIPRFLQCFKAALQHASLPSDLQFPWHAPLTKQLQPSDWFELLRCSLQSPLCCAHPYARRVMSVMRHFGCSSPSNTTAGTWSSEQIETLVQLAASQDDWTAVRVLCLSKPAQQLPTTALTSTLQKLAQAAAAQWEAARNGMQDGLCVPVMAAVAAVIALPSAQDSSPGGLVSDLLQQGVAAHDWRAVEVLLGCPGVLQLLSAGVVHDLMQQLVRNCAQVKPADSEAADEQRLQQLQVELTALRPGPASAEALSGCPASAPILVMQKGPHACFAKLAALPLAPPMVFLNPAALSAATLSQAVKVAEQRGGKAAVERLWQHVPQAAAWQQALRFHKAVGQVCGGAGASGRGLGGVRRVCRRCADVGGALQLGLQSSLQLVRPFVGAWWGVQY